MLAVAADENSENGAIASGRMSQALPGAALSRNSRDTINERKRDGLTGSTSKRAAALLWVKEDANIQLSSPTSRYRPACQTLMAMCAFAKSKELSGDGIS